MTTTVAKTYSMKLEGERKRLVEDMRVAKSEKKARLEVCLLEFILLPRSHER